MRFRNSMGATALTAALLAPIAAQAFDDSKYPDLKGQWRQVAVPTGLPFISLSSIPTSPAVVDSKRR